MSFEGIDLSGRIREMQDRYLETMKDVMRLSVSGGESPADPDLDPAAFTFLGMVQSAAAIWALNGYS
jgi:hypothetical protein